MARVEPFSEPAVDRERAVRELAAACPIFRDALPGCRTDHCRRHPRAFSTGVATYSHLGSDPVHQGSMLRTRGNRDQLVRLANGGRLVDGGRRRQCNFLFSDNTPRR